jgi:hypothetical protein
MNRDIRQEPSFRDGMLDSAANTEVQARRYYERMIDEYQATNTASQICHHEVSEKRKAAWETPDYDRIVAETRPLIQYHR